MVGEASNAAEDEAPLGDVSESPPTYFKPTPNQVLEQGDILSRGFPVIDSTLRQYHQYHVDKDENEFFAVLTQSCDLVPHNGRCKARYISLAPVRSLREVLDREFDEVLLRTPGGQYLLGSEETQQRYEDFLAKLINNNDSRHFFIPERPELGIAEDMCIMLPLALSIKVEHLRECLDGRIAQLDDLFQAKLGWLLGQQYSRVGTPDWPPLALDTKIAAVSNRTLSWFPTYQFEQLKTKVRAFQIEKPGTDLAEGDLTKIRAGLQNRRELAITGVIEVLVQQGYLEAPPNGKCFEIRKALRKNPTFSSVVPAS